MYVQVYVEYESKNHVFVLSYFLEVRGKYKNGEQTRDVRFEFVMRFQTHFSAEKVS